MWNRSLLALTGTVIGLMLVACASTDEDTGYGGASTTEVSMDTATVLTAEFRGSECISPISVYEVDGKNLTTAVQKFELQPGEHTLKGRALITSSFCPRTGLSTGSSPLDPLVYTFEAGKLYKVGVNHKANSERQWFLTVWEVEDKQAR